MDAEETVSVIGALARLLEATYLDGPPTEAQADSWREAAHHARQEYDRLRDEVARLKEYGKYAAFNVGYGAALEEAAKVADGFVGRARDVFERYKEDEEQANLHNHAVNCGRTIAADIRALATTSEVPAATKLGDGETSMEPADCECPVEGHMQGCHRDLIGRMLAATKPAPR